LADRELTAQDQLLDLDLHQGRQRIRLHQLQDGLDGNLSHAHSISVIADC